MLTMFTVPLPFTDRDEISQYNAITSWTLLNPGPEILLLGDEKGTAEFAKVNKLRHIPSLERNELGHISIQSVFKAAIENASNDMLALVDADNILMGDFIATVQDTMGVGRMLCGKRRSITLGIKLDFSAGWEKGLRELVNTTGRLAGGSGSDYSVFSRDLFDVDEIPDFSLGRGHWDGWRMWYALDKGCELVDCTNRILAVHQNHPWRSWKADGGHERNWELATDRMAWVRDATRKL